jgi:hypothetical protein
LFSAPLWREGASIANNTLDDAGHFSGFDRGIEVGQRVSAGDQVIAGDAMKAMGGQVPVAEVDDNLSGA